jgi:hypothetical protein
MSRTSAPGDIPPQRVGRNHPPAGGAFIPTQQYWTPQSHSRFTMLSREEPQPWECDHEHAQSVT